MASFWLVFVTALPAVAPFFLIDDRTMALRISNVTLIFLLYLIGKQWAGYINANRQMVGLGVAAFGLALVQLTIALGG